jgi:hypothetical protein
MASHIHCRVVSPRGIQPQDELFPYIADEHPNIQSALSQSQPSQRLSHDGDRLSRTKLQDALSTTMSALTTITNTPASPDDLMSSPSTVALRITSNLYSFSDHTVLSQSKFEDYRTRYYGNQLLLVYIVA